MARPRSFDREQVVDAATVQFRRAGLHATSAEDLCRVTGLGRSSLYNTFGSKDELFAQCLDAYLDRTLARAEEIIDDAARGTVERIEELLRSVVAEEARRAESGAPRGCLAVNTVTELADDPGHVASIERVGRDTAARLAMLAALLRAGQAAGEVTTSSSAEGLAAFVNSTVAGLRVSSQGRVAAGWCDEIVAATLRALRPERSGG
ncbi:TetR/AcrR family transcriptional regulator [Nocardia sp. NBC_01329]|uniref:TetR/AcrR family transcriptional regulator n=1 Tax=Nocardia sp. NBC_01329 TaxID=2903594 RepID=UPI002E1457BA|nr:TetR/AcrR family transcriptional regulator [Nocardia sp. NBC_01329]